MSRLWVTPEELDDQGSSPYAYEACKTASFILWALSGRKFNGSRTVTERYECPCRSSSTYTLRTGLIEPYIRDGEIGNTFRGGCGCPGTIGGQHTSLRLRGRPVRSVQKVVAGSRTLDPSEYRIINSQVLRSAPGASFDVCGLEITYTYGGEIPAAGRRAARYLAGEFAKSFAGEECDLPDRVTSVSRQGVSFTILDKQDFLDELRTGVYTVDLFLRSVNPDKARKPAKVFSPDLPKAERITANAPISLAPLDLAIVPGRAFSWSAPLSEINGELLADETEWRPQGQITSWNGAILLEFDPDRFDVTDGVLTLTLTGAETSRINIGGSGLWDLYAISTGELSTVVHVMSSNVHLVRQSLTSTP